MRILNPGEMCVLLGAPDSQMDTLLRCLAGRSLTGDVNGNAEFIYLFLTEGSAPPNFSLRRMNFFFVCHLLTQNIFERTRVKLFF